MLGMEFMVFCFCLGFCLFDEEAHDLAFVHVRKRAREADVSL